MCWTKLLLNLLGMVYKKNIRPGRTYFLPKVHKLNKSDVDRILDTGCNTENVIPSGRPIISHSGSFLENIGHYVDHFLIPIVTQQNTYIKDSAAFMNIIEILQPYNDCRLVTYDVTNIFTNCPIDELLSAVEKAYSKFDKNKI
jgi:hypothetical protein